METEIHRRLPNSLRELKAVSSPEVLSTLPSLRYHWCSAVTQNCMSQDCQSYQRVPLSMPMQLFQPDTSEGFFQPDTSEGLSLLCQMTLACAHTACKAAHQTSLPS